MNPHILDRGPGAIRIAPDRPPQQREEEGIDRE
jgi:hypothetical protein